MTTQLMQRISVWLLGSEKRRRRKTLMTALATAMMVYCTLIMRMLVESSGLNPQAVAWWAAIAPAGMLVILVLVRSGWSERFADPSLADVQMVWALSVNAAGYVIAGPVRALALPVLVIIMMFGIFSHDRRHTWYLFFYAMGLYAVAILLAAMLDAPRPAWTVTFAHLTIFMASLLTSTLMSLQVQGIRRHLREQKNQLQNALQQIRQMAMRDELTGLVNRRQMVELMALELRRCERSGRALLLAQLDLDHFKTINDTHGHAAGDLALQAFAQTSVAQLRGGDVLARWGGEEFVLLLSDTEAGATSVLLERLRSAVQAQHVRHADQVIRISVSIGWTQHRQGESLAETLQRADQAVYQAKREGRNRVVQAEARSNAPAARSNTQLEDEAAVASPPESG